jgi:pimeloyl-ACP methyl ester carboxylesterase
MHNVIFLTLSILISSILLSGCVNTPKPSYTENITINECWFKSEKGWPTSKCGILTVPENYSKPDGRKVKLPFILFKAESTNAGADDETFPLVVAGGGGPGSALGISAKDVNSFDESIWSIWYSSTIDAGRDLILMDNRGVGSSMPRLYCYEVEKADMASLDKVLDLDDVIALTEDAFGTCKQRFVDSGIDVAQYHVINAANDLEALRIGLGYKQFNVYGLSYGSRVSLVYERLYPASVRALILDAIYPQSSKPFENIPRIYYEAIKRIIDKCQEDSRCMEQFGFNLEQRLADYLEQLDKNPVTVRITNPENYEPIDVVVTPDVFFNSIHTMMYDEYAIAYIPKFLYSAFSGNIDYLSEMVRDYYVSSIVIDSLDLGAYASYACFDDYPFADHEASRAAIKKYPLQHYTNQYVPDVIKTMCDVWDVPAADASFKENYKIETPVLIYSGELDPITPAELAKPVIENARISWDIVWPNLSHGAMLFSDCADWTAAAFLEDPESDPFIYECSDEPRKLDFVIR